MHLPFSFYIIITRKFIIARKYFYITKKRASKALTNHLAFDIMFEYDGVWLSFSFRVANSLELLGSLGTKRTIEAS